MRHLRALIVSDACMNVMRVLGAKREHFRFRVHHEAFGDQHQWEKSQVSRIFGSC